MTAGLLTGSSSRLVKNAKLIFQSFFLVNLPYQGPQFPDGQEPDSGKTCLIHFTTFVSSDSTVRLPYDFCPLSVATTLVLKAVGRWCPATKVVFVEIYQFVSDVRSDGLTSHREVIAVQKDTALGTFRGAVVLVGVVWDGLAVLVCQDFTTGTQLDAFCYDGI